jgi:hypothetical protein
MVGEPLAISTASHAVTGATFNLARDRHGRILAVSAEDEAGMRLLAGAWNAPVSWARGEQWQGERPVPGAHAYWRKETGG